jgi:hypothetical protein
MSIGAYLRSLRLQISTAAGVRGAVRVCRVILAKRLGKGGAGEPVAVPMKALGGEPLYVRPATSDLRNASYYYSEHLYLPAPELAGVDLRQICELGTNMGAALTALAHRYRSARLFGVEPDPGNAAIAARNVARFGDRCEVVTAGVWDVDAELVVDRDTRYGEPGLMVRERTPEVGASMPGTTALSIDSLLASQMPDGVVDYVHMTIEATEPRVLKAGGEWPRRVRSLRVEAHPEFGYPAAELIADLERLGYRAWTDETYPDKWVFALRSVG